MTKNKITTKSKWTAIIVFCLFGAYCQAQSVNNDITTVLKNRVTYPIWSHYNVTYDKGEETMFDIEDESYIFIASLPREVKTIIAHYSQLPYGKWAGGKETKYKLAQALGNFATLEKAQKTLLSEWNDEQFKNKRQHICALSLTLQRIDTLLFFKYYWEQFNNKQRTDKFTIGNNGQITYTPDPEPLEYVPYDIKKIVDYGYTIKLNGEPVQYLDTFLFLDPDNIESVAVNKRDRIVYITQKNKNPEWFFRSDIAQHLDSLKNFKAKSLKEIFFFYIVRESTKERFDFYPKGDKIEKNAIIGINSFVENYGKKQFKGVIVVIK